MPAGPAFFGGVVFAGTPKLIAHLGAGHVTLVFAVAWTPWLLLDAELLPWSAKAGPLLRDQYAAVGAAARASLPVAVSVLGQAAAAGLDVGDLLERTRARELNAAAFTDAYRRYCWPTDGLTGVRIAPFQLLAAEGGRLAATYVCPHFPEVSGPCLCRKPGLAHFLAARDRFGLTLERSWWVGDRISDLEPARSFGGSGILVRTGNGTGAVEEATAMGFAVVEDLAAAVELALGREAAS